MGALPHPAPISGASYSSVELLPSDDGVVLLDQRKLPELEEYVVLKTHEEVARAISDMLVRGAPAIGIAAGYGLVLAAHAAGGRAELERAAQRLTGTRRTAVNLRWVVERLLDAARAHGAREGLVEALAEAARQIHRDDVTNNRLLAKLGAAQVTDGATLLTHCNAGALATGGYGTALGVIRAAREAGKRVRVIADETRPYLQGSRLTAWELAKDGIDVEVIADASAASFFGRGAIDLVVVGADRIATNGDVANKIGTYSVACLARVHERPFYVAAPWSSVDERCPGGSAIPIEEREEAELTELAGRRVVPLGVHARNPAFDVTPAALVSAIFTERGRIEPVGAEQIATLSAHKTF